MSGVGSVEQRADRVHEVGDAGPGRGRPGEHRVQRRRPGLRGHQGHQLLRGAVPSLDVRRQQHVVVLGQGDRLALVEGVVVGGVRGEPGDPGAEPSSRPHRQDVRAQPAPYRVEHGVDVCPGAVDLVDEDQGRYAESLQRAHEDPRLRLHALDGGQHQHGAVQHAEDTLDLGDEVGVAGGVDDVDVDVAEREPDDGGLDRDAATAFEREAVGAGGAGVDRPGPVDDPGVVQESLGEGGLTGVDVGEDAQVETSAWMDVTARVVPSRRWMRTGACVARISVPLSWDVTVAGLSGAPHRRQGGTPLQRLIRRAPRGRR